MDRRLADKNLRTGLFAAAVAFGVFAIAFLLASYYLS